MNSSKEEVAIRTKLSFLSFLQIKRKREREREKERGRITVFILTISYKSNK